MELGFTGNWFVDLGILGFVNLMEEVYGWNIKELEEKISSDEDIIFYGLFPIAYLKHWLTVRNYKVSGKQVKYGEIKRELEEVESPQEKFNKVWWNYVIPMFEEVWIETVIRKVLEKRGIHRNWENSLAQAFCEFIKSLDNFLRNYENDLKDLLGKKKAVRSLTIEDLKKIENYSGSNAGSSSGNLPDDLENFRKSFQKLRESLSKHWESLQESKPLNLKIDDTSRILFRLPVDHRFFKNFMFFNQSKNIWEQRDLFYKLISFDFKEASLQKIDKAVNKLFPSDKEFPNETYTSFSTENLRNISDKLFVYLLCFPEAFKRVWGINIAFYSHSMEFSYLVNKKINILKNHKDRKPDSVLKITWRQIVDTLWEFKSSWALENMYLIQYKKLDNQSQQDVEYIGINKLQAQFVIDDNIRDALNTQIRIIDKGDSPNIWLLQEFIKNRPLIPIFYRNLSLYFSQKINYVTTKALVYSAALDKVIAGLGFERRGLFLDEFFHRSSSTIEEAKDVIQRYFRLKQTTGELFSQISPDNRKSLAYRFFSKLRRDQKYPFVNELLRELNGKGDQDVEKLIRHTFENILSNDRTWQSEAIPILAGLIGGASDE